jgi:hypothetical protein
VKFLYQLNKIKNSVSYVFFTRRVYPEYEANNQKESADNYSTNQEKCLGGGSFLGTLM